MSKLSVAISIRYINTRSVNTKYITSVILIILFKMNSNKPSSEWNSLSLGLTFEFHEIYSSLHTSNQQLSLSLKFGKLSTPFFALAFARVNCLADFVCPSRCLYLDVFASLIFLRLFDLPSRQQNKTFVFLLSWKSCILTLKKNFRTNKHVIAKLHVLPNPLPEKKITFRSYML